MSKSISGNSDSIIFNFQGLNLNFEKNQLPIPIEIVVKILSYLGNEALKCRGVSRQFNHAVCASDLKIKILTCQLVGILKKSQGSPYYWSGCISLAKYYLMQNSFNQAKEVWSKSNSSKCMMFTEEKLIWKHIKGFDINDTLNELEKFETGKALFKGIRALLNSGKLTEKLIKERLLTTNKPLFTLALWTAHTCLLFFEGKKDLAKNSFKEVLYESSKMVDSPIYHHNLYAVVRLLKRNNLFDYAVEMLPVHEPFIQTRLPPFLPSSYALKPVLKMLKALVQQQKFEEACGLALDPKNLPNQKASLEELAALLFSQKHYREAFEIRKLSEGSVRKMVLRAFELVTEQNVDEAKAILQQWRFFVKDADQILSFVRKLLSQNRDEEAIKFVQKYVAPASREHFLEQLMDLFTKNHKLKMAKKVFGLIQKHPNAFSPHKAVYFCASQIESLAVALAKEGEEEEALKLAKELSRDRRGSVFHALALNTKEESTLKDYLSKIYDNEKVRASYVQFLLKMIFNEKEIENRLATIQEEVSPSVRSLNLSVLGLKCVELDKIPQAQVFFQQSLEELRSIPPNKDHHNGLGRYDACVILVKILIFIGWTELALKIREEILSPEDQSISGEMIKIQQYLIETELEKKPLSYEALSSDWNAKY